LRLFDAHHDEYGFQPIIVLDGEGRFITLAADRKYIYDEQDETVLENLHNDSPK
jgi:hypothetical protein